MNTLKIGDCRLLVETQAFVNCVEVKCYWYNCLWPVGNLIFPYFYAWSLMWQLYCVYDAPWSTYVLKNISLYVWSLIWEVCKHFHSCCWCIWYIGDSIEWYMLLCERASTDYVEVYFCRHWHCCKAWGRWQRLRPAPLLFLLFSPIVLVARFNHRRCNL